MTEKRYYVKMANDGKLKFYIQETDVKIIKTRQAKKSDITEALNDIRRKREGYDKALQEFIR